MKFKLKTVVGSLLSVAMMVLPFSASADDALKETLDKGELSFALTGQYPPFSFINEEGELVGFDVEIGMEIANRLEVEGKPVQTAWDGILAGLLANKYDAIIGSMAITDERKKSVDFTDTYYRSGAQLFVRADSEASGLDDMSDKKIGVGLGETYEAWMQENRPEIELASYKGLPLIIADLMNNRLDGFITDKVAGTLTIKDKEIPAKPVGELLYPEDIGIAIKQKRDSLKDAINQALAEMKEDGTYEQISKKWVGIDIR